MPAGASSAGGKAILITGASTGIGRACALRWAERGGKVFAGVRRREDADLLREEGGAGVEPVFLDVTKPEQIDEAVALIRKHRSGTGLDGLVNNAGIVVAGPAEFVALEDWRRQIEVNLLGQIAVTQAFLPALRQQRGRLVFMSSIAGRATAPFMGPYSASKHALEALATALRLELRPWRIRVATIEPGSMDTPIWEKSKQANRALSEEHPLRAEELYGRAYRRFGELVDKAAREAAPVEKVVDAVLHALTARRPRTHYLVGSDARFRAALDWLPTRWVDWIIARYVGL